MRVLGIDPGIATTGYGIIEEENNKLKVIDYGCIITEKNKLFQDRLKEIYHGFISIIRKYRPDVIAIEEIFFAKNVKTAISVGHARGVMMLSAINEGVGISEYTPLQVKIAVVGYGRAEKYQVQDMLKTIFKLKIIPKPDDAADALAIAYCHISSARSWQKL
jgi:crossover junction endodeoxyribonuclease RuvC